ncbi:MAG: hypothetical protein L6R40_008812, partial [Gallowayella cf. fulva]
FATELYTISYLILFSILGTLARLGLQALTFYPGAPVATGVLWANFAGSLIMGFLSEDRALFRQHHIPPSTASAIPSSSTNPTPNSTSTSIKRTVPLYIGLTTGFCGSLTSFSSFIRDAFLALSNDLLTPTTNTPPTSSIIPRSPGQTFLALLAILILTPALSLAALQTGAHIALALEPCTPSLPFPLTRRFLDRLTVPLACLAWLGAILMSIWPPDRNSADTWRGKALFALVFSPLGCLARFYASRRLNGRVASFPLGTLAVNILGTAVLGIAPASVVWEVREVREVRS